MKNNKPSKDPKLGNRKKNMRELKKYNFISTNNEMHKQKILQRILFSYAEIKVQIFLKLDSIIYSIIDQNGLKKKEI